MNDPGIVDPKLLDRLKIVRQRVAHLNEELMNQDVLSAPDRLRVIGQERAELDPLVRLAERIDTLITEYEGAQLLLNDTEDHEFRDLASQEISELTSHITRLSSEAQELLVPKDPLDSKASVIEVRAGTGGDEAGLFAKDLVRMYQRVAEREGWTVEFLSISEGIPGSVKEAVFTVRGKGVYGKLRFESGVHRVQRVPETESQGRIHTSAATVAVLPEADEVDVKIDPGDLRIDVFRSSGPGGQSVNTTDSAVRLTHVPTGLVVSCQDEKSQHKNKAKALKVLRSRLLDQSIAQQEAERSRQRKAQVGTGDRSAKIRTYNFPQNRVTDHRVKLTIYSLDQVLDGDLTELITVLKAADQEERLQEQLN
ncbi:MAG TPA: peptide chain release factor 1 [Gemmatimonadetes bacterium]|jgi:peptide chain release factor 1|nr:peptide chain release factor 1 [Gemmatimonadota bacterium]